MNGISVEEEQRQRVDVVVDLLEKAVVSRLKREAAVGIDDHGVASPKRRFGDFVAGDILRVRVRWEPPRLRYTEQSLAFNIAAQMDCAGSPSEMCSVRV